MKQLSAGSTHDVIELGIQENASLCSITSAFGGVEAQARGVLQTLSTYGERLKGARNERCGSFTFQLLSVIQFADVGRYGFCGSVQFRVAFCRQEASG
jgi:hypothetical protein